MGDLPLAVDMPQIGETQSADMQNALSTPQGFLSLVAPAVIASRQAATKALNDAAAFKKAQNFAGSQDPSAAFAAALDSQVALIDRVSQDISQAKQRQYEINARVPKELQAIAGFFGLSDYNADAQELRIEQAAQQAKTGQAKLAVIAQAADEVAKRDAMAVEAQQRALAIAESGAAGLRNVETFARQKTMWDLGGMSAQQLDALAKDPSKMRQMGIGPDDIAQQKADIQHRNTQLASAAMALENARLTNKTASLQYANQAVQSALVYTPDNQLDEIAKSGSIKLPDGTMHAIPVSMVQAAKAERQQLIAERETKSSKLMADRQIATLEYTAATDNLDRIASASTREVNGITIPGFLDMDPVEDRKLRLQHTLITRAYEAGNFTIATELSKKLNDDVTKLVDSAITKLPEPQQAAAKEKFTYGRVRNHQVASEAMQSVFNAATQPIDSDDRVYYRAAELLRQAALDAQNQSNVLMDFGKPGDKKTGTGLNLTRQREKDLQTFETMLTGPKGAQAKEALYRGYENVWMLGALQRLGATEQAAPAFRQLFVGGNKLLPEFTLPNDGVNIVAVAGKLAEQDAKAGGVAREGSNIDLLMKQLVDPTFIADVQRRDQAGHNTLVHDLMRTRLLNGNIAQPIPALRNAILQEAGQVELKIRDPRNQTFMGGYAGQ